MPLRALGGFGAGELLHLFCGEENIVWDRAALLAMLKLNAPNRAGERYTAASGAVQVRMLVMCDVCMAMCDAIIIGDDLHHPMQSRL